MKFVVILCDGMSDEPLDELKGRTPLAVAKTSHMDTLARMSEIGMVHTIPKGKPIDVESANLSVFGYDSSDFNTVSEEGQKIEDFYTKTGKKSAVITVDEKMKAFAAAVNMKVYEVDGATGGLNTNYSGKKDAAVTALFDDDYDFVIIHVKAVNEASISKSIEKKIKAIENIDAYIVGPLVEEIQGRDAEFRLLVMPYFPTYVRIGSSESDAVPYLIYDSGLEVEGNLVYSEKSAKESGCYFDEGNMLLNHFLEME